MASEPIGEEGRHRWAKVLVHPLTDEQAGVAHAHGLLAVDPRTVEPPVEGPVVCLDCGGTLMAVAERPCAPAGSAGLVLPGDEGFDGGG